MDPAKLQEAYDALSRGGGEVPRDPRDVDVLLDAVFEARRSTDVAKRLAALRVAEAVGARAGLDLVETFMQDPAIEVRRYAFNLGLAAKQDGLQIVREAAADPDPELALEALRMLVIAVDRSSTTRARTLLSHEDVRVRAAAIRLLGHVAGPAVKRELELQKAKGGPEVGQAVDEALARIDGHLPRAKPGQWWDSPPPPSERAKKPKPASDSGGDSVAPENLGSSMTLDPDGNPQDSTWGPEVDREGPLWGPLVPSDGGPSIPPGEMWIPDRAVPLPPALPTHAFALLRLLGMVAPEDRGPVIEALRIADPDALLDNVNGHQPGKDPARGRGIGIAAKILEKKAWLPKIRRLLGDPEPLVRAASVEALGLLGGPSLLTQVSGLLIDEDPRVRRAAVETLGEACVRWGLQGILPQWLEQVREDADPGVREARDQVMARAKPA